jgi:serine/threonine protein kinase
MNNFNIGRYEVIKELGQGGMAVVYLAFDPYTKRQVAIKVLPRQYMADPQFLVRFRREAEAIAALEHPTIVPIYDYGENDEQPFIVMRYMPGGSLASRLANQTLSLLEIAALINRLAPALEVAHQCGMVHRDLKPANILFDQWGEAYLSDFGIVKMTEATAAFTGSHLIGTPAYMSPEQAGGKGEIDGRSDIYSLSVMIFELLTHQLPFEADTPVRLAVAHILEPVPDIRKLNPALPPAVGTILQKGLAKQPEERYQSVIELADNFSSLVNLPVLHQSRPSNAITLLRAPVRKSLWIPSFPTRRVMFSTLFVVTPLFMLSAVFLGGVFASSYMLATATPTASATIPPTATLTNTTAPTNTLTQSTTPTYTPTWTATTTHTATFTATVWRSPTPTPTFTATPLPACPEGEFFDVIMDRCRRFEEGQPSNGDNGNDSGGSPPRPTLTCEEIYYPDPCSSTDKTDSTSNDHSTSQSQ